ncbi:hypothetical protein JOC94_003235 [Bacillus thermophilus]|uniref:ABC-2 family transporter protein n=1 Tax=Siminovitchia thermophila TaxID=1245522 RepID=A0ABS2R989_9BACI|nr:hypothetical protein [Siminovitchia thermophila]MBM7716215.1 hypothetical protein [Siminovitchia thermophila]
MMELFKKVIIRECWTLWNYIKFRLIFISIVLFLLLGVLFVNSENGTLLDIVYGMLQVPADGGNPLTSNINWLTIQLLPIFLVGTYVYEDLFQSGPFILLRIRSRRLLWFSKVFILAVITLLYYLLIFVFVEIMGFFFHVSTWSESQIIYIELSDHLLGLTVSFLVGTFTLLMLQAILSIMFTPMLGIILVVILCVVNLYFNTFFFPGHISDVLAYSIMDGELQFMLGFTFHLLLTTVLILLGSHYYKKVDLLYRK